MRGRVDGWVVVAAVAAVTAIASFLPTSGLLSAPAGPAPAPRSIGAPAADRPVRPVIDGDAGAAHASTRAPLTATIAAAASAPPAARPAGPAADAPTTRPTAPARTRANRHRHAPARTRSGAEHASPHRRGHAAREAHRHRAGAGHGGGVRARVVRRTPVRPAVGPRGADVSWPQCRRGAGAIEGLRGLGLPMPHHRSRFVVIGLTNGPGFTANPCLADQVRWARRHHVHTGAYAVASFPSRAELHRHGAHGPWSRHDAVGRLRNTGFEQARRAVARMHATGLRAPLVWIDVEPAGRRPWAGRPRLNAAVVHGAVRGYRSAGLRVGFYSTTAMWRQIVGSLRYRAPEWRSAGPSSPAAALARCHQPRSSIQGGRPVIAQWWTNTRDHDLLCPGSRHPRRLDRFFHDF